MGFRCIISLDVLLVKDSISFFLEWEDIMFFFVLILKVLLLERWGCLLVIMLLKELIFWMGLVMVFIFFLVWLVFGFSLKNWLRIIMRLWLGWVCFLLVWNKFVIMLRERLWIIILRGWRVR